MASRKPKIKNQLPEVIINYPTGKVKLEGEESILYIIFYYCSDSGYRKRWKPLLPPDLLKRAEAAYEQKKMRYKKKPNPEYNAYISSKEWKAFRKHILETRNCCEKCGKNDTELHIHHLTYANFTHELDDDVAVLCWQCHEAVHGKRIGFH